MRKLLGLVLLLLAFPMFTGGGFEISGMMGRPSLLWAIVLTLGADFALLAAGFVSSPKKGKTGFFRGLAFTSYLIQSFGLAVFFFELWYGKVAHAAVDNDQMTFAFVIPASALTLLLISTKAWHLFAKEASTLTSHEPKTTGQV